MRQQGSRETACDDTAALSELAAALLGWQPQQVSTMKEAAAVETMLETAIGALTAHADEEVMARPSRVLRAFSRVYM
jgi:hypothetical protein